MTINGGNGDDTLVGGTNDDLINGGNGDDTLIGAAGSDDLNGGNGDDSLDGGADDDALSGGNGSDTLDGGDGSDQLSGGNGIDSLDGGEGDDELSGGNGDDTLDGGADDDTLSGDNGSDTLDGGAGSDTVLGDLGDDVAIYVMSENAGATDAYDGGKGTDTLRLVLTQSEYDSAAVQADLLAYQAFLTSNTAPGSVTGPIFQFAAFDLTARNFEQLEIIIVPGGANAPPVAVADDNADDPVVEAGVGPGNTPNADDPSATGNVLANDTDADAGDTQTVVGVSAGNVSGPLSGGVGVRIIGTYGRLELAADGTWIYAIDNGDPDTQGLADGASAADVFTYTMADGDGATSTTTLTIAITGTNTLPIAAADGNGGDAVVESGVVAGDDTATGNVLDNDTDADTGATATVIGVKAGTGAAPVTTGVGATIAGVYGSLTLAADGTWTYTLDDADPDTDALAEGALAADVFTYTVADEHGATSNATLTVDITGANDAPTAGDDSAAGSEDQVVVIPAATLLANDSDPDTGASLSIQSVDGVTNGTVVLDGGNVEFTPDADFSGQASFTYTVTDGSATSTATVNLDIAPVADAPTLTIGEVASVDPTPVPLTGDILVGAYSGNPALDDFQHMESTITALANGGFVVVWNANRADGTGFDAKARIYDADGQAQSDVIAVSQSGFGEPSSRYPSVAGLDNGGFVIAYPYTSPYDPFIRTKIYDSSGNETNTVDIGGPGGGLGPSVAALDGGYIVAWATTNPPAGDGPTILAQRFGNDGNALAPAFQAPTFNGPSPFVGAPNYAPHGFQIAQEVAVLADGGFVIVWQSLLQDAWDGGNSGDQYGIYGQRFDANNVPVGAEFRVNTVVEASQITPSVAALANGGFIVTWTSPDGAGRGIFGQLYDAVGVPVGGEISVDNNLGVHQQRASVVGLPDSGFLVAWEADGGDGSGFAVFGQRFDAAGASLGASFIVEAVGDQDQRQPDYTSGGSTVTVLADGTLAVTWSTTFPGTVSARLFDLPNGGAVEDQPYELPPITAALTDLDGSETLALSLTGFPAGATFSVGHADGAAWVIDDAGDIAGLATTPLVMIPPADFNGPVTLTVTAIATDTATLSGGPAVDTNSTSATIEIDFAPVNDPPVAEPDDNASDALVEAGLAGPGDASATGNVLANDTDVDIGDSQTVVGVAAGTPGGPVTTGVGAGIAGTYGTLSLAADGTWTYSLDNADADTQALQDGDIGEDVFTYTMADSAGATATTTLTIEIAGSEDPLVAYMTGSSDPWGIPASDPGSPDAAMDTVFGAGAWTKFQGFTATALTSNYDFLYIDGGDGTSTEFNGFITANVTALENWVAGGGHLVINAARWDLPALDLGFGVTLSAGYSETGTAIDSGNPMFSGPFGSAGTTWSGNYFSHDIVSGAGLNALIEGTEGTVLADMQYGDGYVMFGGITDAYFHSPQPEAYALRANMLSYADTIAI